MRGLHRRILRTWCGRAGSEVSARCVAVVLAVLVVLAAPTVGKRSQGGFELATPAFAFSANPRAPDPPLVFPAHHAPRNARLIVVATDAWLASSFPDSKAATATELQVGLADTVGEVPFRQSPMGVGSDGIIVTPERALAAGTLLVSIAPRGAAPVVLARIEIDDRVDRALPTWTGPIRVDGSQGTLLGSRAKIAVWTGPFADGDSPSGELAFELTAHTLSYGKRGSRALIYPASGSTMLSADVCFMDNYGVDARGVDASMRLIDAAGHESPSFRFAGRCENGTTIYPAASGAPVWPLVAGVGLLSGAALVWWRYRRTHTPRSSL